VYDTVISNNLTTKWYTAVLNELPTGDAPITVSILPTLLVLTIHAAHTIHHHHPQHSKNLTTHQY
jgi:hypothetical protein